MRKNLIFAALALAGLATLGFTPTRHDNSYTTNGVTYAQRGGLGSADYVVTNVDADAVGRVKSVNGKTGVVTLSASDVGALPSGTTHLSGDVPITRTVNGKSLQYNITLNSSDVGAVARDANYLAVSNAAVNSVQTETDPTVPSWAKEDNKPTYTAREVSAIPYDYVDNADIIHTTEFISFDNDVIFGENDAVVTIGTNNLYFGNTKYTGVSAFPNDAGYLDDSSLSPITNALWTGYTPWRVYRDGTDVSASAVQPHYRADLDKWEVGDAVYADGGENATTITWSDFDGEYSAMRKAISFTKVSQLENDAGYISADTNRIVIGRNHETSADTDIICIGGTCKSTATNSTAIGFGAFAVGDYSTAIGVSDANGLWNTSVGVNNQTFYGYSSAFGVENYIYGGFSTALGILNQVYGNYAFSAGLQNSSTNVQFTTVLGYNNSIDSSPYTTIVGRNNKAEVSNSSGSTLVGGGNESKGQFSVVVGSSSKAHGDSSTAIGSMTEAIGYEAIAIGQSVTASNSWSVAIGQSAIATNNNAIVIGSSGTFLDRPRSHGNGTITFGHSSVDETKVYIGDRSLASVIDSRAFPTSGGTISGGIEVHGNSTFYGDTFSFSDTFKIRFMDAIMTPYFEILGSDVYLPLGGGTLALTSDIPNTMAWGAITGKPAFSAVATSGNYSDLSNTPANVSAFVNDAGYLTDASISETVSNTVTTAFVRERLGVYLYVGEDGGIYVHTNEE